MTWLSKVAAGLRALWHRDRLDRELDEELESFLDAAIDRHMQSGLSREQALLAARRELGSRVSVKQAVHQTGWEVHLDGLWRDLVYAARSFSRAPMFTIVAVLTLGLGIGATTAIFSIVHGVLLKPLPYRDSDRMVRLYMNAPPEESPSKRQFRGAPGLTADQIGEVRARVRGFSQVGTATGVLRGLPSVEEAARLQGSRVSAGVFEMISARPAIGRAFSVEDEAPGAPPVVLLSHTAWQRYLHADPDILGKELAMDSVLGPRLEFRYTVIGIMPPQFAYPDQLTHFWLPFQSATPEGVAQRGPLVARLADGVSSEAALEELTPVLRALRPEAPGTRYELAFEQRELVAAVRPALLVLMAAVGFVLLIACVNVANLLLARSAARQREMAVRVAIGAGRGRLIRQMLTESLLLASLGGIVGTVLAFGGVRALKALATTMNRIDVSPGVFPRVDSIGIDVTVLGFSLAVCVVTGILFGLVPALLHSQIDPVPGLKGAGDAAQPRLFARFGIRQSLVIAEVSLAVVLLVGGMLLSRSFFALAGVNPGYDAEQVLTFQVSLPNARFANPRLRLFAEDLTARLRALPAVQAAAYANQLPMVNLSDTGGGLYFTPDAARPPTPLGPELRLVSREYLRVFGIGVAAGRGFAEGDDASRPQVMLVNQALVGSVFNGENPIGRSVFVGRNVVPWEIVGIVNDVRQYGLDRSPTPQFFVDLRQWSGSSVVFPVGPYFAVRAGVDPQSLIPAVREAITVASAEGALFNVATMTALVANNVARPKLYAVLLGGFGLSGLALALIGIYGVMAYTVTQRTREIGIRMSLGAAQGDVLGLVLRQSLVLTAIGVTLGLGGAALASRYLESLLFGVTPLDVATFTAVALMFVVVAGLAAYVPARRAARIDPLIALRCE